MVVALLPILPIDVEPMPDVPRFQCVAITLVSEFVGVRRLFSPNQLLYLFINAEYFEKK